MGGIEGRLRSFEERYDELERELSAQDAYQDVERIQRLSQEQARLREVVETGRAWRRAAAAAAEAEEMRRQESDPEMVALAEDELRVQREREQAAHDHLRELLVPTDPNDERDVVVEIRAGTGGDEA
ncbi:MAG: PCRF domain-containing protein, partial [Candidatus Dormibacteria bacterium]